MIYAQHQFQSRPAEASQPNLGACVADLMNVFDKGMTDEVEAYDLSSLEFSILRTCMQRGECTTTQLAEMLPVDAPRISRMVTRLVNMGLMSRRRLQDDRRVVMLRLTKRGNELTLQIDQRVRRYDAKLMEGVTEEEIQVFASATARILANYVALHQPG